MFCPFPNSPEKSMARTTAKRNPDCSVVAIPTVPRPPQTPPPLIRSICRRFPSSSPFSASICHRRREEGAEAEVNADVRADEDNRACWIRYSCESLENECDILTNYQSKLPNIVEWLIAT